MKARREHVSRRASHTVTGRDRPSASDTVRPFGGGQRGERPWGRLAPIGRRSWRKWVEPSLTPTIATFFGPPVHDMVRLAGSAGLNSSVAHTSRALTGSPALTPPVVMHNLPNDPTDGALTVAWWGENVKCPSYFSCQTAPKLQRTSGTVAATLTGRWRFAIRTARRITSSWALPVRGSSRRI